MTKEEEASKLIAEKIAQAEALIKECEKLGKENDVSFSWNLAYGMGGYYGPAWGSSSEEEEWAWNSSSESC
jgi:hypothetical protein